jgi:hypothetical protein
VLILENDAIVQQLNKRLLEAMARVAQEEHFRSGISGWMFAKLQMELISK